MTSTLTFAAAFFLFATTAFSQTQKQDPVQALREAALLRLADEVEDLGEKALLYVHSLNPEDASANYNLGRVYLRKYEYTKALIHLQKSEQAAPDLWLITLFKARALNALGKTKEAEDAFRETIRKSPERWVGYFYLAVFLKLHNRIAEAQNALREIFRHDRGYELKEPAPTAYYQDPPDSSLYARIYYEIMNKSIEAEDAFWSRVRD